MKDYTLTLITPPAVEPISLTEAKKFLRIDTVDDPGGLTPIQSISPGSHVVSPGANGASVDILGYTSTIILSAGACSGTVDVTIEESNDNITFTPYSTFARVTAANDNADYTLLYSGDNRYIRAIAVIGTEACEFGVTIMLDQRETAENDYISGLITTARQYCEGYQNRAYITQTWEMALQEFPRARKDHLTEYRYSDVVEIPKGNLQTIDSFTFTDYSGTVNTLVQDINYIVSTRGILGRISPPYAVIWPPNPLLPLDPIVIKFTCGYGDNATDVPLKVKQAIYLLIGHWYENRVPVELALRNAGEIAFTLSALLRQDRLVNV
jgi:uncharacterized phiE125 gp8 family phage protein